MFTHDQFPVGNDDRLQLYVFQYLDISVQRQSAMCFVFNCAISISSNGGYKSFKSISSVVSTPKLCRIVETIICRRHLVLVSCGV